MERILLTDGTIVTQNESREIIDEGAVAISGDTIEMVGPKATVESSFDPDRQINVSGKLLLPGLINAHTHVTDILLRGLGASDRELIDWIYNVKLPGAAAMTVEEHELAAALYCWESVRSGITTFVDNSAEMQVDDLDSIRAKLHAFANSGLRTIYAHGVRDNQPSDSFKNHIESITSREPNIAHPPAKAYISSTSEWVDTVEDLIDTYHGSADGRLEVWIGPVVIDGMTPEGLRESYRLAESHDVMTTIHTAETPTDDSAEQSSVETLHANNCLGEHALLGHCVSVSAQDIELLSRTNTSVSHNIASNMALGNGFAPVPEMRDQQIPVGIGTDNSILSDQVNVLGDLRLATLAHKGHRQDVSVLPAQDVLDMATIDGAQAIRKADSIGSIEPGKRADIIVLDPDVPHMTPAANVVRSVVYQTRGTEIETVLCDGNVIMEAGRVSILHEYPDLRGRCLEAAQRIAMDSGLGSITG